MPQLTVFYSSQEAAESEASAHLATLEKPFKCTACDASFTTNAALNIHSKTHLTGQKLKCSMCPYVTNDYNELRKHRLNDTCKGKQQLFRCHACDFICHSKPMMKTHFFSAHTDPEKLHECPDCDFKALKINALNIHIKQQHSAPMEYACTSCDFVCNSQSVIKNHIIKRHSDENIDIDAEQENEPAAEQDVTNVNKYACASCDYMCSSMAQIKEHIAANHTNDSPVKSTNQQNFDESADPSPEGAAVQRKLSDIEEPEPMIRYSKTGPLKADVPFVKKFSCRECNFQCFTQRGIRLHMGKVHKFIQVGKPDKDAQKNKQLQRVDYVVEPIPIGHHPDPGKEKINSHDERRMYKCPLCSFEGTLFGFKIHRNNHMSWKCTTCGVNCKSESRLQKHMKTHAGYSCTLCDFHCETDLGFQSHMDLSHNTAAKRFSCPKCNFKCNTQMDLRRHVAVHEPQKQFTCPECEDSYDEKSELMHHMLSMNHTGGKPFPCNKCKAQFLTESGLKIHLECHEPEPDMSEMYSDEEMSDEYDEDEDGDKSPRKVINDFDEDYIFEDDEEDDDPEPDDWLYEPNAKKVQKIKLLRCFYNTCPFRSHSFKGLQIHISSHNEMEKDKREKLSCAHSSCEYTAITIKGMLLHIKMIHDNFASEEKNTEANFATGGEISSGERLLKCPECKYIGTSQGLANHSHVHGEKPKPVKVKLLKILGTEADSSQSEFDMIKCPDCDYVGTAKGLQSHSKVHTASYKFKIMNPTDLGNPTYQEKNSYYNFKCDLCNYYHGKTARGLEVHMSRAHPEEKKDVAAETQKLPAGFKVKLTQSKNAVKPNKKRADDKLSPKKVVENHEIDHPVTDGELFACDHCDYVGSFRGYRSHLKVHSRDIFACPDCDFTCLKKGALDAHVKKKHNKKKCKVCDYVGSAKGLKSHSKAHTREKPFACKECDFKCLTQKVLDTHIQRLHGNSEFSCSMCDYKGVSAQGLNFHSQRIHNIKVPYTTSNNKTHFEDDISPDNESSIENEEIIPKKEPIESEVISSNAESDLNTEGIIPTQESSVNDNEETPTGESETNEAAYRKEGSDKRIRQVNQKYSNKDYVLAGSTTKQDNTEPQSKRLKKDHKENNDDIEEGSLKNVNKQPENKEQENISNAPESDSTTPSRPKRIKLTRNNTPGKDDNNKDTQKKDDDVKKAAQKEESASKQVNKSAAKEVPIANKSKNAKRKNNEDTENDKLENVHTKGLVKDNKSTPGKKGFLQNADKKKKFDEYMKAQGNKANGATPSSIDQSPAQENKKNVQKKSQENKPDGPATPDRKNVKREKGLTCLCLECGARFSTKEALEKHMSSHL